MYLTNNEVELAFFGALIFFFYCVLYMSVVQFWRRGAGGNLMVSLSLYNVVIIIFPACMLCVCVCEVNPLS